MSTEKSVIIEVAITLLLFYKLNAFYQIKKLLHGRKATFRKIKPWDCFTCINVWIAGIVSSIMHDSIYEAMYFVAFATILSFVIEKHIEG